MKPRRWVLLLALIVVTLFQLLPGGGDVYAQYVYPLVARALSAVSGWAPFSVSGVFYFIGVIVLVMYPIVSLARRKHTKRHVLVMEVELMLWLYVWFYGAWGLNYWQSDFYQRTATPRAEYAELDLLRFANEYVKKLNESYIQITYNDEAAVQREMVQAYRQLSEKMGIHSPFMEYPQVKTMLLTPFASKVGVTGTMGPFFGEFIVNGDLLPCEYAATYAHEFSHFLGITSEGEANFYGYLACTSSKDGAIRFSGYLSIYHHVLRAVQGVGQAEYEAILQQVRPEIIALDNQRREHWRALYSNKLGKMQDSIYDYYLRHNRIEEGRKSYSTVIALLMSYNNINHDKEYSL